MGLNNISYASNVKAVGEQGKQNQLIPSPYSVTVPEEVSNNSFVEDFLIKASKKVFNGNVCSIENVNRYSLKDKYDIEVKNQGNIPLCWADSLLTAIETNIKTKLNVDVNLSETYLNYATSDSFNDGENKLSFNRSVRNGGSTLIGLASLTNGQGAVLEEKMPFNYNLNDISINNMKIKPDLYVKGYTALPIIYKNIENGNLVYSDGYGKTYTTDEVQKIRNMIKKYILENGAITSYTASNAKEYYNNESIFSSTAYYCNNTSIPVDHAITIVGWDDNYSKENFRGIAKPNNDGAYIVLNSYSDENFDDGYLYISYEDVWIETMLYGINEVSKVDYDNLYQHNEFGVTMPMTITNDENKLKEGYYANVFKRNTSNLEVLNQISIPTNQYAKFEVYVNPNGSDLNVNNLIKVATTDFLNPGYNTIKFDDVVLNGENFAIVVKHIAMEDTFYCMIESKVEGTFFENVYANVGESKISVDGVEWKDLAELGNFNYEGYEINLAQSDICIKAFTNTLNESKLVNVSYIKKVIYDNESIMGILSQINLHKAIDIILKMV